jgi:hypothetical protein
MATRNPVRVLITFFLTTMTFVVLSGFTPRNNCINCNTNGCTSPPPGHLIGHWDSDSGSGQWGLNGAYHTECVYYISDPDSGYSTCDPHGSCTGGEENLAVALVRAAARGDRQAVGELLAQSKTLVFNAERRSIQGVSACDKTAVIRNIPLRCRQVINFTDDLERGIL